MGYEVYGLKENPFPKGGAILKPQSTDPRENGSIFCIDARAREIREFEQKFIGTKTSFDDRQRCGFLWAEGDRVSGRGMGKTALAIYMRHKVNNGYGRNYFEGQEKFFCGYVSFSQQMVAKMGLFFQEALNAFTKDSVLNEVSKTSNAEALIKEGVEAKFAQAVMSNSARDYLEKEILGHSLDLRFTTRDWRVDPILTDTFMNQTTRCLRASGFKGGILLVDDLENLTDRSTPKQVETFIKDFGLAFFRASNEASTSSFYTVILTTHRQSADKIGQAWTVAGLSSSYPLVPGGPASLLTRKPDLEQSVDMVKHYLEYFRDTASPLPNEFFPFTRDAVEAVVKDSDFHPRRFLSRLYRIVVEALSKDMKEIDAAFVSAVPELEEEEPPGVEQL